MTSEQTHKVPCRRENSLTGHWCGRDTKKSFGQLWQIRVFELICFPPQQRIRAQWHGFFNFVTSRVRHCDWLVANATKNWALATRNLELVAGRRLTFCPLGIWNSKVNGLFLKEHIKLPWRIVVKQSDEFTIAITTRRRQSWITTAHV